MYISSDLSWSEHIKQVCVKAKTMIDLLYWNFYHHIQGPRLLQLYKSLVRPHLEFAAVIWSPHLQSDKLLLEGVQKFALRMVTRGWHLSYPNLLYETGVMSLQCRREVARLCHLYKILNSLCYSNLCVFPSTQVTYTTHILSLSSHYSVVPILFPTPLFPSLYIYGTVLMLLYVLSPPLCHLNITLLISILIGIMSCIRSTLLFTCIPFFHANINKKTLLVCF